MIILKKLEGGAEYERCIDLKCRKTKIERLYGKGDNSIGSHISFEECRPGWRENTEAVTKR
jgi:hypothetical protein